MSIYTYMYKHVYQLLTFTLKVKLLRLQSLKQNHDTSADGEEVIPTVAFHAGERSIQMA